MSEGEDTKTPERVLSDEEEKEIKDCFEGLDKNGNGVIEASEFVLAWRSMGENPTDDEVEGALKSMDKDNDGDVSFDEFRKFIISSPVKTPEEQKQELMDAFKKFDRDSDGFVRRDELRTVLCKGSHPVPVEDADELFKMIDANDDGKINIDEFTRLLLCISGEVEPE